MATGFLIGFTACLGLLSVNFYSQPRGYIQLFGYLALVNKVLRFERFMSLYTSIVFWSLII